MDVVYGVLESVHAFIPVVAIVACLVIIYFWGSRSYVDEEPEEKSQEGEFSGSRRRRKKKVIDQFLERILEICRLFILAER